MTNELLDVALDILAVAPGMAPVALALRGTRGALPLLHDILTRLDAGMPPDELRRAVAPSADADIKRELLADILPKVPS